VFQVLVGSESSHDAAAAGSAVTRVTVKATTRAALASTAGLRTTIVLHAIAAIPAALRFWPSRAKVIDREGDGPIPCRLPLEAAGGKT
jgi:hypothetical protein